MILVGADPEVFVKKQGEFFSGHGLIQGTKEEPMPVEYGAVQVDGMALEFNITPASTRSEFVHNIGQVLSTLKKMVPEYEVVAVPVADFDIMHMLEQPMEAIQLGCTPDFNAYSGVANVSPDGNGFFRTASGHVHIGWTDDAPIEPSRNNNHFNLCRTVVRELDFTLGIPSLLWDNDQRRRELYGAPGAFRPKAYGTEYRVLSNVWLNYEELTGWIFDKVQETTDKVLKGGPLIQNLHDFPHYLFSVNSSHKNLVDHINHYKLEVPKCIAI